MKTKLIVGGIIIATVVAIIIIIIVAVVLLTGGEEEPTIPDGGGMPPPTNGGISPPSNDDDDNGGSSDDSGVDRNTGTVVTIDDFEQGDVINDLLDNKKLQFRNVSSGKKLTAVPNKSGKGYAVNTYDVGTHLWKFENDMLMHTGRENEPLANVGSSQIYLSGNSDNTKIDLVLVQKDPLIVNIKFADSNQGLAESSSGYVWKAGSGFGGGSRQWRVIKN